MLQEFNIRDTYESDLVKKERPEVGSNKVLFSEKKKKFGLASYFTCLRFEE